MIAAPRRSWVKSNQALIASLRCSYPRHQVRHDFWLAYVQGELIALIDYAPTTTAEKRFANRWSITLRRIAYMVHQWLR